MRLLSFLAEVLPAWLLQLLCAPLATVHQTAPAELLADSRCCHSCRTELERNEPVPFRLTRNLQTFFTPFGVEGVFITGLSVAAMVGCPGIALLCSAWAVHLSAGWRVASSMGCPWQVHIHQMVGLSRLWHVPACQCSQS